MLRRTINKWQPTEKVREWVGGRLAEIKDTLYFFEFYKMLFFIII